MKDFIEEKELEYFDTNKNKLMADIKTGNFLIKIIINYIFFIFNSI